jgi:hypothetical protein
VLRLPSLAALLEVRPLAQLIYKDDSSEVWHGDSLNGGDAEQIMGVRVANLLCVDAPYSEKTHSGHKNGKLTADRAATFGAAHSDAPTPESRYAARKSKGGDSGRRDLKYPAWTPEIVESFVQLWASHAVGWMVSITDDVLSQYWRAAFERTGRFAFPCLPLVETGSRCRLGGDGPSPWTCFVMVARPRNREFASWGTLPGAYVQAAERDINSRGGSDRIVGGKPLRSMMAIVRDYSRPGDLVVDPCCGAGTTGLAAKMQGRRFIGVDSDLEHCELTARRLRDARHQTSLFPELAV